MAADVADMAGDGVATNVAGAEDVAGDVADIGM